MAAFVTEATMFGFGKNRVWYQTYETADSHSLPLSVFSGVVYNHVVGN